MTDYLEWLLSGEEETEIDEFPLLTKKRTVLKRKTGKRKEQNDTETRRKKPEPPSFSANTFRQENRLFSVPIERDEQPESEWERISGQGAAEMLLKAQAGKSLARWEKAAEVEDEAVVESLYDTLRKTERLALSGKAAPKTVTVSLPEEGGTEKPLDILALDRAVERNARCYDNGFSLY